MEKIGGQSILKSSSRSPKSSGSGRVHLTRSTSESNAMANDFSKLLKSPMQSVDDNELDKGGTKAAAALSLSSSNSMPNLSKYDVAPDVSTWVDDIDLDFPFELYSDDNVQTEGGKGTAGRKRSGPASNSKRKAQQTELAARGIGTQDKTQFFSPEQMSNKTEAGAQSSTAVAATITTTTMTERKSQSTSGSSSHKMDTSSDLSMHNSSSASVDTRDTMASLARRVEPVDRDGVEFAPLDGELHPNLSNSYSMSLDEGMILDNSMSQSLLDKKLLLEAPESFSMSSWSQQSVSVDVFSAQKMEGFSRDGLFIARRNASDQSITEQMLNDEEADNWNSASLDLDLLDSSHDKSQSHSVSNHTMSNNHNTSSHSSRRSHGSSAHNVNVHNSPGQSLKPTAAIRGNRPPLMARNAKLNLQPPQKEFIGQMASKSGDSELAELLAHSDLAGLIPSALEVPPPPPLPPMDPFTQQYSFPSTYSLARGNSSQPGSPSSTSTYSSADGSSTGGNPVPPYPYNPTMVPVPVYDPSTGIVYYPHLPQGAMGMQGMPMGQYQQAGLGPGLQRLVPLGQHVDASLPIHAGFLPVRPEGAMSPVDDGSRPGVVRKVSGSKAIFDSSISATVINGPSNSGAQVKKDKKDKNRGSYRCGRCGKPKVNHVCTFVDTTTVSQAVQAKGPVLNPSTMQPFPTDRVLTVNPARKTIQDRENMYENLGMIGEGSRSGSLQQYSVSRSNSGITADSLVRSSSSVQSEVFQRSASSAQSEMFQRSNSSVQSEGLHRSNSGSEIFPAFSRSGDDSLVPATPLSPGSGGRPSVNFMQPVAQTNEQKEQIQQHLLHSDDADGDDVFFPTTFPPGGGPGNLVFSSRNSSVNSTYGNESDTSSTCGDNSSAPRSTFGSLFSSSGVDLSLGKFFRFTS